MIICKNEVLASFENGLYSKGKVWFTDADLNNLYCFELEQKAVESICIIDKEEENGHRLFSVVIPYKDEMILIPFSAKSVYRIHIKERTYYQCKIDNPKDGIYDDYTDESKFMSAFLWNDIVYMVGATYPAIAEYNPVTNQIKYYSDWIHELRTFFNDSRDKALFRKTCMYEGKIYAPCCKANAILIFDVNKCKYEIVKVGPSDDNYSCICFARDSFWIASRKTSACYKVSKDLKLWNKLTFSVEEKMNCCGYRDIVVFESKIYVIPSNKEEIYFIDLNDVINRAFNIEGGICFDSQFLMSNGLCFGAKRSGTIYYIDDKNVLKGWSITLPVSNKKRTKAYKELLCMNSILEKKVFTEEYDGILLDFIKFVPETKKIICKDSLYSRGNVIYNCMKKYT